MAKDVIDSWLADSTPFNGRIADFPDAFPKVRLNFCFHSYFGAAGAYPVYSAHIRYRIVGKNLPRRCKCAARYSCPCARNGVALFNWSMSAFEIKTCFQPMSATTVKHWQDGGGINID